MELHHSKHHQAYVTNLNSALQRYATASVPDQIALQAAIKFNGGGHINHSLFWQNLAPANSSVTAMEASAPTLSAAISASWGSPETFKASFTSALMGIQGSGWGWLVKDGNALRIVTTKDQDPIVGGEVPIFGVDMWEHAYYLQVCLCIIVSLRKHCGRKPSSASHANANAIYSTKTARPPTSRTSGRSSTGRRQRSDSRAAVTMPLPSSRRP